MKTAGRKWFVMALLLLAAAGCRRKAHNSHAPGDDDIFTTDEFPGGPVQDGNVADDLRAFSASGESVSATLVQFNGDRGTAIAAYTSQGTQVNAPYHVYVHYFDGESWTPPVTLQAPGIDFTQAAFPAIVAFLNTSNNAASSAQARNGDAIILWNATDFDEDGLATLDGPNTCLYASYFDVTHASEPENRYGFQELGVRLNTRDMLNENVENIGIVTDGLCGETRGFQPGTFQYGQDTTGIVATWIQREDNDLATPFTDDRSLWSAFFDLDSNPDPESPLVPAPAVRLPILQFGASDTGLGSEETQVSGNTIVYNNVIFFRVASNQTAGSGLAGNDFPPGGFSAAYGGTMNTDGDDVTLQEIAFDLGTGSFSGPHLLMSGAPDSTDAFESNMSFLYTNAGLGLSPILPTQSVWGSDEGLAQLIIVYCELAFDADALTDFGSGAQDGGLFARGIDESDGTVQSGVIISADDPTIFDTVIEGDVQARLSRNGDYLWIAWLQPDASGTFDDLALHAAQIKTTRPAEDGTFTLPPISLATSATLDLSSDIDNFDVGWFQIQNGLGYVCGAQSDPDVMNICFEHSDFLSDEVFVARLTAGHAVPPAPSMTVTSFETFDDGDQSGGGHVNDTGVNFNSCDSGDGGHAVAFYRRDSDASLSTDFRFYARRTDGGSRVEIGSGSSERQADSDEIELVVTPPGSSIGVFDPVTSEDSPDRTHGAQTVHVFLREDRYVHNSGTGMALRARAYHGTDSSLSLDQSISPPVGTSFAPPFEVELPFVDPDAQDSVRITGFAVEGSTVGLWFTELGHVYYQEFGEGGDAWLSDEGVSNPILVDDDSAEIVTFPARLYTNGCSCSTLRGAMCFWVKILDGASGERRLQVRIRD